MNGLKYMKWWGWGDEDIFFDITKHPNLLSYITNAVGFSTAPFATKPVATLETIQLPQPNLNQEFLNVLSSLIPNLFITFEKKDRLIHSFGKSYRDLWRVRHGKVTNAPDCICYPNSEKEITCIIHAAIKHNVILIPFGGGTNIVGGVEAPKENINRMVVVISMRKMNQILEIDNYSMLARIQAGALGPEIELELNEKGFTLGHFPDSFEYSSIGGWVATRSAGMQSDKYGKIEDMVVSLRMATPSGLLETLQVPKSSNGIDVNQIAIGSEGILGVITEISVQIHPLPESTCSLGYLFPNFEKGVSAIYECVRSGHFPDMTRLNDSDKTALSFAYQKKGSTLKSIKTACFKSFIKRIKKYNLETMCLMLVTFVGTKKNVAFRKRMAGKVYRQFGGICLGASPGRSFEEGKYEFPYLRDFLMDINCGVDVSETATTWSNLLPLYQSSRKAIMSAIQETGVKPWCGCHISHTYHTGASLYFTFAYRENNNPLQQYDSIKQAAENSFIQNGGTLSHHHAVGYEHMHWLNKDISDVGIKALCGLKNKLDNTWIMNPGKIIPQ